MYCFTAAWHRKYGPALTPPGQHPQIKRTDPRIYSNANPVAHQPRGEFDMPMGLGQIPRFEEINRCRINIFQQVTLIIILLILKRKSSVMVLQELFQTDEHFMHCKVLLC